MYLTGRLLAGADRVEGHTEQEASVAPRRETRLVLGRKMR